MVRSRSVHEGVGGDGGSPEGDRPRARQVTALERGRKGGMLLRRIAGGGRSGRREPLEDWRDRAVAGLERGCQGDLVGEALDAAGTSGTNELLRDGHGRQQRRPFRRGDERHSEATGRPLRDPARVSGELALGALRPADTRAAAAQGRGARTAVRRPRCRTRRCWRRFRPISTARRRAPSEGGQESGSRTRVLRVISCSPRTAAARAPRGCMPGRSSRRAGTDGVRVFTLDDGCGSHRSSTEPMARVQGWEPAALEPIAQGLRRIYGALDAERSRAPDGPRQPVLVRPLSQPDPVLGHAAQRLCRGTGNTAWRRIARAHLPEPQGGRDAVPRSWSGTTRPGGSI